MSSIKAVLFDLDGTLIDTWQDLMLSANHVLKLHHYSIMDHNDARLMATDGMIPMLRSVMGDDIRNFDQQMLKKEFLDYYLSNIHVRSRLFDGFEKLIPYLERKNIKWGIVTNKPGFLTIPLITSFNELLNINVCVCNETVPEKKPHPAPLKYALNQLNIQNSRDAIYVGDHIRDIECANNANTISVAAGWGYFPAQTDLGSWNATYIAKQPLDLIQIIEKCN